MKAAPKGGVTAAPLDLRRYPRRGSARAVRFIERWVTVPKGTGARHRVIDTTAARMVELNEELAARVQVFKDHLLDLRATTLGAHMVPGS
jgi:hypothetical protein